MKRIVSYILVFIFLISMSTTAFADEILRRAVIGADSE